MTRCGVTTVCQCHGMAMCRLSATSIDKRRLHTITASDILFHRLSLSLQSQLPYPRDVTLQSADTIRKR